MSTTPDAPASRSETPIEPSLPGAVAPTPKPLGHPVPHRIPSLDGLRAVAIGLVLVGHFLSSAGTPRLLPEFLAVIVGNGRLGVTIFFAISGLLITRLLMNEEDKLGRIDLKDFYLRRAFRILPACFAFLAFIAVMKLLGILQVSTANILSGMFFVLNYSPANQSWEMAHIWSLSVEEQFYLLWPFAMVMLGRRRSLQIGVALIVVMPFVRVLQHVLLPETRPQISIMLHTRIDALMYGCVASLAMGQPAFERLYSRLCRLHLHWIVPAFAVIVGAQLLARFGGGWRMPFGFAIDSLASTIAMVWLIRNPTSLAGRIMNLRWVTAIGVLSYSLYLWQQPFFAHDPMGWPATFPYNVFFVIGCALASYFLIEQPFLRLRSKLLKSGKPKHT